MKPFRVKLKDGADECTQVGLRFPRDWKRACWTYRNIGPSKYPQLKRKFMRDAARDHFRRKNEERYFKKALKRGLLS